METHLNKHGRFCITSSYRTYEEWKLGNGWTAKDALGCSYRTYEEWKHHVHIYITTFIISSYRTYEEWKLAFDLLYRVSTVFGSYRTYEEWKRFFGTGTKNNYNGVLTVPMRNGNKDGTLIMVGRN